MNNPTDISHKTHSVAEVYYANFGSWSVEEYYLHHFLENPIELNRIELCAMTIPSEVESVLDVGCGGGLFLHHLARNRSLRLAGLEITPAKVLYARKQLGLDVIQGSAEALPYRDNSFDLVAAQEVLEHLPFEVYEKALAELQRVARRYILITVPCEERRVFTECPYCGCQWSENYHFRSFNEQTLQLLFQYYSLLSVQRIAPSPYPLGVKSLLRHSRRVTKQLGEFSSCPACGFTDGAREATSGRVVSPPALRRWLVKGLRWLIPKTSRHRWLLAVYQERDFDCKGV